jgi:hypothetical protein
MSGVSHACMQIHSNTFFWSTQSCPALPAYTPVDICAQIFAACRASPVQSAEPDESSDEYNLSCKDTLFRYLSEEIRTLIEQNEKYNEQEGYCHSEELPALAHPKIFCNLLMVFFHNK